MTLPLSRPEPLSDDHQVDSFDSGEPVLDDWLRRRARANQASGASRSYVVCDGRRVIAYYALASGAIAQAASFGEISQEHARSDSGRRAGAVGRLSELPGTWAWTSLGGHPKPAMRGHLKTGQLDS